MVKYQCLYCSYEWFPEKKYYFTAGNDEEKCPKCNDSNIKKLKYEEEKRDCFGYNLEFLKKKVVKKKEE